MSKVRASESHPLQVGTVDLPDGGRIGVTFCPGKRQHDAMTGRWARNLEADLEAIRAWGAAAVITLIEDHEFAELSVEGLGEGVRTLGMQWHHLPIPDMSVPDNTWERRWQETAPAIHRLLSEGGKVVVHCKGGLGRAGTVAARLLIERGHTADDAMVKVRAARPGAIENATQERYLQGLQARPITPV
jgi:protein-tyrosine phosphatase